MTSDDNVQLKMCVIRSLSMKGETASSSNVKFSLKRVDKTRVYIVAEKGVVSCH